MQEHISPENVRKEWFSENQLCCVCQMIGIGWNTRARQPNAGLGFQAFEYWLSN